MPENSSTSPTSTNFWTRVYTQLHTSSSALLYAIIGAFPSYVSRHFNALSHTLRYYTFYFIRVPFIRSFNKSIALIIPALTTYLQLKYQGQDKKESPFATHPRTMRVAVSSSVAYYLAYIVLLRFPSSDFAVVAHHCLLFSGYASVASLASLLFPDSVSPFVYAVFVLLAAAELFHFLYHKLVVEEGADFPTYGRRIRRLWNKMCRVVSNSAGQRPQILPF